MPPPRHGGVFERCCDARRRTASPSAGRGQHFGTSSSSPTIAEDAVLTVCDEAAETTHRWIEQDCGAYVIVTFVVVTGCDNSELLARRVVRRAGQTPASDAHGVVNWLEIAEASIQDLTADHYL